MKILKLQNLGIKKNRHLSDKNIAKLIKVKLELNIKSDTFVKSKKIK